MNKYLKSHCWPCFPSGSKWPAKLTKLEGKPQLSQVSIIIRTPSPIFNFSSELSFALSLGLHAAYLQNLVRLILRRKQHSFILKTVIVKNTRGRKKKRRRQANGSALVSDSPHSASFLAHTARSDIEGRSASREPHGLPKGIRSWPSPLPLLPHLQGPTASFTNS